VDCSGNDLDLTTFLKIVSFAKASDCPCIHFTGGEPTIHSRLPEVMEILSKNNLKFTMVTNGWNFLDFYQSIKPYLINIKRLDFSLDGATEDIHDLNRTKGSYRRVLQAVSICRYKGIPFGLRATITKRNIHQLENIAFLAAKVGTEELTFNPVQPTSRIAALKLLLHPDDLKKITDEVLRLQKIFKIKITRSTGYFDSDFLALCYPLTMKELFINSKGKISFCCQLTDHEDSQNDTDLIGNLDEISLYEAHQRMVDAVGNYEKEKIQRLAKGNLGNLDYYPCWYCLKYFKKVDWLTQFPDNPWSQDILKSKSKVWEKDVVAVQKDIFESHQELGKKNGGKSAFQPNDEVIETVLAKDEGTLIHLDTKLSYALNRTGLRIWFLLKEGYNIDEVVENIHEEFEGDQDRVKKDVVGLIEELLSLKLITPLNEGPTNWVDIASTQQRNRCRNEL
jgi:MoaA/NifB/PqqE/SkfB family radical SAM enzyme